jgi:hypothetical protein
LDLAPAIINWPAQRPPTHRRSPHGDARWPSAKRQGGPDPPETKVGVSFCFDALGNGIVQRILEYHRFAEDCRKLASCLVNPRHKQKLQEMAAVWDMLAIERKLDLEEKPD